MSKVAENWAKLKQFRKEATMAKERQPDEVLREKARKFQESYLRENARRLFSGAQSIREVELMAAFAQSIQAETLQQIEELQQQLATEKELKQLNWVPKITYEQQLAEARAPLNDFLEHITWMRDHAAKRVEEQVDSPIGPRLAIPADSQLNAYIQGQRDTCTELLARWRELEKDAAEKALEP